MFRLLIGAFLLLITAVITVAYWLSPNPHSPLPLLPQTPSASVTAPLAILGFLPYWTINQLSQNALASVTDVAYFSLTLDQSGDLKTKESPTTSDLGYYHFINNEHISLLLSPASPRLHLVIKPDQPHQLVDFLADRTATNQSLIVIRSLVTTYPIAGINLDFEPPTPISSASAAFTTYVSAIKQILSEVNPQLELSLDVYASAATKPNLWDLAALAPHVDYFVVMGYDYAQSLDSFTNSTAPLYAPHPAPAIIPHLRQFLLTPIPPSKIFLGIPLYGYSWLSLTPAPISATLPRSGSLTTLKEFWPSQTTALWDPYSLTPYTIQPEGTAYRITHTENAASLSLKKQLATDLGLRGVAFWALGYEDSQGQALEVFLP